MHWRPDQEEGKKAAVAKTGLGNRAHGAASRLRSGSLTRLCYAAKRRKPPQNVNYMKANPLTNLFQDLTKKQD